MKKVIVSLLAFGPMVAAAQTPNLSYASNLLDQIRSLVNLALPIVVALALLGFFIGLAQFIFNAGNDDKRAEGKKHMIWGVVGFFVMVGVWGLVAFLANVTGVNTSTGAPIVSVPTVVTH